MDKLGLISKLTNGRQVLSSFEKLETPMAIACTHL